MTLEETIAALPEKTKLEIAICFLEIGLPIWEQFVQEPTTDLTYYAFMLGMETVDPKIIMESIQITKQWMTPQSAAAQAQLKVRLKSLVDSFAMHLSAIRDWELELAPHPQLIFYAALNLLDYLNGNTTASSKESTVYISINQSIDAIVKANLLNWQEVNTILERYN